MNSNYRWLQPNAGWVQAWKSAADQRRQKIADALKAPPKYPALRSYYLKMAQDVVNRQKATAEIRKDAVDAYYSDRDSLSQILSTSNPGGGSSYGTGGKPTGSLG
jgi:hypothetical protein